MTTPARVSWGAQLVDELPAILEAGGHPTPDLVTVTRDARDVDKVANLHNGMIVVLPAPDLEFPGPGQCTVTWSVVVLTSTTGNVLEQWERLDALLDALRAGGLPITEATAEGQQRPDGPVLPAYVTKLTYYTKG
jgi:hypothetical protein